jgi:serine/threonine protein kinase
VNGFPDETNFCEQLYKRAGEMRQVENGSLFEQLLDLPDRYVVESLIGRGGMKEIYQCRDLAAGRQVALARLQDGLGPEAVELFLREARITASLQHPNIVPVYDIGVDAEGRPFFVMKRLSGSDLQSHLSQRNPSLGERVAIFRKICEAISYAHRQGVLHLDLKPANILIGDYGEVTVCDWGLARLVCAEAAEASLLEDAALETAELHLLTRHGEIKGTPGYMAPEQVLGHAAPKTVATDIYGLGAILHTLLSGEVPVPGGSFEEIRSNTLKGQIRPIHSPGQDPVPMALEAICRRCLDVSPEHRYADCGEILDDISAWQQGFATRAERARPGRLLLLFLKRNQTLCLMAALMLLSLLVYTALFIRQQQIHLNLLAIQKEQIEQALDGYHKERQNAEKRSMELAENYANLANRAFIKLQLREAQSCNEKALTFDPQNVKANTLQGKLLFQAQRFAEAIPYFEHANDYYRNYYLADCRRFAQDVDPASGCLPIEDFVSFISRLPNDNTISRYMMKDMVARQPDSEKSWQLAKRFLLLRNPGLSELKAVFDPEAQSLDLSGNPFLVNIDCLAGLDLRELDLSGCSVRDLAAFHECRLERLSLARSSVRSLEDVSMPALLELDLSSCRIDSIENIPHSSLQILILRDTFVPDLLNVRSFPALRSLSVSRALIPPEWIRKLRARKSFSVNDL